MMPASLYKYLNSLTYSTWTNRRNWALAVKTLASVGANYIERVDDFLIPKQINIKNGQSQNCVCMCEYSFLIKLFLPL